MLLLYRQIELARAKAVVKLADIAKEYEEVTLDSFRKVCDASDKTEEIAAVFDKRTKLENFCKNSDNLQKEIDRLTRDHIISRHKILHVIGNCKGLHMNSSMSWFYLDDEWVEFESNTPCSGDCPVFTDAGLSLLNEWENRLDTGHQRLHLESHAFSLEEFFRHLLPGKKHADYQLDSDLTNKHEAGNEDEYLHTPMAEALDRLKSSVFGIKREWVRGVAIFLSLFFVLAVIYGTDIGGEPDDSYRHRQTIVAEERPGYSYEKLRDMFLNSEGRKNVELEQEVKNLKQQVYVLQQASAKHDNFLQNLGMER